MPGIDTIAIVVRDMGRTLGFYRLLGLATPEAADGEAYVVMDLGCGLSMTLNVEDVERSSNPGWQVPRVPARMGIAFRCEDATEVDAVYAEIIDAGYEGDLAPFDAQWGSRHCRILDPDGNAVDLFAPLP